MCVCGRFRRMLRMLFALCLRSVRTMVVCCVGCGLLFAFVFRCWDLYPFELLFELCAHFFSARRTSRAQSACNIHTTPMNHEYNMRTQHIQHNPPAVHASKPWKWKRRIHSNSAHVTLADCQDCIIASTLSITAGNRALPASTSTTGAQQNKPADQDSQTQAQHPRVATRRDGRRKTRSKKGDAKESEVRDPACVSLNSLIPPTSASCLAFHHSTA